MALRVGELLILGFKGPTVPEWLKNFEQKFGLGGVILFDYDIKTKIYENNILSREQLVSLTASLSRMKSHPLIFIDQEGGKVRRLKKSLGFSDLPSAKAQAALSLPERAELLRSSFSEMKKLGIHFDLAPVVDMDLNPKNPDIGAIERSYSADANIVRENGLLAGRVAAEVGLGLCLKHFPGLGGATTNSHLELTDISDSISDEQLFLFYELVDQIPGRAILMSHGMVRPWDVTFPVSMSKLASERIRERLPDVLLLTDDLQMQGLQYRLFC